MTFSVSSRVCRRVKQPIRVGVAHERHQRCLGNDGKAHPEWGRRKALSLILGPERTSSLFFLIISQSLHTMCNFKYLFVLERSLKNKGILARSKQKRSDHPARNRPNLREEQRDWSLRPLNGRQKWQGLPSPCSCNQQHSLDYHSVGDLLPQLPS